MPFRKKIGGSKRGLVEIRRCGYEATGGAVSSQWFGEVGAQVGKTKVLKLRCCTTYKTTLIEALGSGWTTTRSCTFPNSGLVFGCLCHAHARAVVTWPKWSSV